MPLATAAMPTNKQRLTLNIPSDLYDALEACAGRANRTLANQAAIALEEFLLKSGDLSSPVKLALQGRPRKSGTLKAVHPDNDQASKAVADEAPQAIVAVDQIRDGF
jgi:hypothetical protein